MKKIAEFYKKISSFITEYEYRNYLTNLKKEFDKKKKHIFLSGN